MQRFNKFKLQAAFRFRREASDRTASLHVSTRTCGRLAQGQSGRTQAELLEGNPTLRVGNACGSTPLCYCSFRRLIAHWFKRNGRSFLPERTSQPVATSDHERDDLTAHRRRGKSIRPTAVRASLESPFRQNGPTGSP